jgi:uncharacterized membrane protein
MSYGTPPPPPPPPPGYGAPGPYGAAQPSRTSGLAIASLVTGILGIFPCCLVGIVSILGIVFGVVARKNIDASQGAEKGRGMATAGLICGVVGLVIGIVYWIVVVATGNYEFDYYTS